VTRSRVAALALVPVLALSGLGALTACSGGDDGPATSGKSPTDVLADAKKTLDATSGVDVTLATKDLPKGTTGITSATGTGVHPSAFEGTFKLVASGFPADASVIAVDGKTYAKSGLLLPDWTAIDPADYGAPDPAALMDPDGGFSGLLSAATDVKAGKSVRGGADNKEILTSYTATLPASAVAALIPTAEGDFDVTYAITDDSELRTAEITGDFYGSAKGEVTYDLTLDDYGTTKQITAP
jgi:lipoprotein LprG